MRLDIALVRLLGLEVALDDDIGVLEARLDVAMAEFGDLGDVRGLLRLGLDTFGEAVACSTGAVGFTASSTSVTCGSTS